MELVIPKQAEILKKDEMMYLEGGIAPLVAGGIAVGIFAAGAGLGYWSTRW